MVWTIGDRVIQLLVVVALWRKWGHDPIWTLTERIINKWNGTLKG